MKQTIKNIIQQTSTLLPLSFWINRSQQKLFLPFYHAIQSEQALPHIEHLYTLRSQKTFEADLDFMLKHFEPIDLAQVWKIAKDELQLDKPAMMLSFDDGLREVHDVALPILRKKGIPATIFLNTDFIDNRGLFFRYKASLLIDHLQKKEVSTSALKAIGDQLNIQNTSIDNICAALLKINYGNKNILDNIAPVLKIDFNHFLKQQQPYLSSDQIKDMQKEGFTFGSHSIDHPLYHQLSFEEQLRQTQESVASIQAQFNPAIQSFSFPFTDYGVQKAYFKTIAQSNLLDLSFGCAGVKKDSIPFHFQRLAMEGNHSPAHKLVAGAYFSYIVKSLIGKHIIKR